MNICSKDLVVLFVRKVVHYQNTCVYIVCIICTVCLSHRHKSRIDFPTSILRLLQHFLGKLAINLRQDAGNKNRHPQYSQSLQIDTGSPRVHVGRPPVHSKSSISTTLLRFSYSRLFYYIVCFPQRSSQRQKSCSLPPAVAADQSKPSHWNCIATPANSRDFQREPGIPQNPARSYFETCTRRPGQHLPGPGHDFHIRG